MVIKFPDAMFTIVNVMENILGFHSTWLQHFQSIQESNPGTVFFGAVDTDVAHQVDLALVDRRGLTVEPVTMEGWKSRRLKEVEEVAEQQHLSIDLHRVTYINPILHQY